MAPRLVLPARAERTARSVNQHPRAAASSQYCAVEHPSPIIGTPAAMSASRYLVAAVDAQLIVVPPSRAQQYTSSNTDFPRAPRPVITAADADRHRGASSLAALQHVWYASVARMASAIAVASGLRDRAAASLSADACILASHCCAKASADAAERAAAPVRVSWVTDGSEITIFKFLCGFGVPRLALHYCLPIGEAACEESTLVGSPAGHPAEHPAPHSNSASNPVR